MSAARTSIARRLPLWTGLALLALSAACGGAGPSGVRLVSTSARGEMTVQSDAPRLVAASKELTGLLGHEVKFDLDAALLPEHAPHLETAFADAVETTTRVLSIVKRDDPRAFAFVAPSIGALVVRYDATLRAPIGHLDVASRELRIRVPRASFSLVTDKAVLTAIEDAHQAHIAERYAKADPKALTQDELAEMWDTILHHWRYEKKQDPPPPPPSWDLARKIVDQDARGRAILRALSLHAHAKGKLRELVTDWLVAERHYLMGAWEHHPDVARRAPKDAVLKHVQSAWVAWLNAEMPTLAAPHKVQIARALFLGRPNDQAFAHEALAGFDAFAFGLGVFDAWVKAGMPNDAQGDAELADTILCPHRVDEAGRLTRNRGCAPGWHRMAVSAKRRERFAQIALKAPPHASASIAAGLARESDQAIAFMRSLEPSAAHHTAVARVLADEVQKGSREALRVEGFRMYRAGAAHRGAALYLLASTRFAYGFDDITPGLAPRPSAAELGAMLDVAPGAMRFAPDGWGHFGGAREAQTVVARLDRFIDDRATAAAHRGEPDATIDKLVAAACRTGRPGDLAALSGYFARRVAAHPNEAPRWAGARDQTRPGACLKRTRPPASVDGRRKKDKF